MTRFEELKDSQDVALEVIDKAITNAPNKNVREYLKEHRIKLLEIRNFLCYLGKILEVNS